MGSTEDCEQNKSGAWSSRTICLSLNTTQGRSPAILLAPLLLAGLPDPSVCDQLKCPSFFPLNLHLMCLGVQCKHCFQIKASAPDKRGIDVISKYMKNRRCPQSGPSRHQQEHQWAQCGARLEEGAGGPCWRKGRHRGLSLLSNWVYPVLRGLVEEQVTSLG